MRIFDSDIQLRTIVGEMINIECAKKIFENGQLIVSNKHSSYPELQHEGVRTIVKSNYGYLFLSEIGDGFIRNILRMFDELEEEARELLIKYGRISGYTPVYTHNSGFTVTRIKDINYQDGTSVERSGYLMTKKKKNRVIWLNTYTGNANLGNHLTKNKFTWIVHSLSNLVGDIIGKASSTGVFYKELVTIVWDTDNTLKPKGVLNRDLVPEDITRVNKIKNIAYIGDTEKYEDDIQALCIINGYAKKAQDTRKQILSKYSAIEKDLITSSKSTEVPKSPGFVRSYHRGKLYYCNTRKGAFELIRQFGNHYVISSIMSREVIKILGIPQVYEVDFKHLTIDNTIIDSKRDFAETERYLEKFKRPVLDNPDPTDDQTDELEPAMVKPVPNDRCHSCHTPLYDDVYIYLNSMENRTGIAVCTVCTHSGFTTNLKRIASHHEVRYFSYSQIIVKTKYPRTRDELIEQIQDDTVRDIVHAMYYSTPIRTDNIGSSLRTVVLNYPPDDKPVYIMANTLNQYKQFITKKPSGITTDDWESIMANGIVFEARLLRAS